MACTNPKTDTTTAYKALIRQIVHQTGTADFNVSIVFEGDELTGVDPLCKSLARLGCTVDWTKKYDPSNKAEVEHCMRALRNSNAGEQ